MEEQLKETKIEEIKKQISDIVDLNNVEELIKNNEIEFINNDVRYRVKKPTFQQKKDAYNKKIEKFTKLLDEVDEEGKPKYKLEDDLKKSYLKRNINIDDMNVVGIGLSRKRDDLLFKLGEALKNKAPDNELSEFKNEIQAINNKINTIVIEKTKLLEFSIENQCLIHLYTYLTYLITEKYIQGKDLGEGNKEADIGWVKAWNSWEEFQNSDEMLLNQASYYTTLIGGMEH
jgi:hypothetical protein